MKKEVVIIIAEDDEGHATLIKRNLKRAGIRNKLVHLKDGEETLDYLFKRGEGPHLQDECSYLLLLDIRMPKVDGTEVLRQIKKNKNLRKIPVVILTTTDDPREVNRLHSLGCSNYIVKPIDYENFIKVIRQLGLFLMVIEVPKIE